MQNNIRELREKKGLSLGDVTRLTGIHKSDLSRVERGLTELHPGWRRKLEGVLGDSIVSR